jgi:ElaB/YqjD/DUF883 family membrane-anchored ribosome-binding protein
MPADRPGFDAQTDLYPTQPGSGQGRMQGQGGEVKEKVQHLAHETQEKLGDQLQSGLSSVKERAASNLDTIAQSLTQSTQQARQQDPDAPVQYMERIGEELQRASRYLRETEVREFVRQTEDFARRQPVVFLGAAFAIGLIGARFLKSSERKEQSERYEERELYRAPAQISDRERPVAGYREPNAGLSGGGSLSSRGIAGRAGDPEWSGTPGGFPGQR